jgi:2-polyprenyl-6-methoxyphenol hydroxylase-like FAD-dependent oxidoreductase
MNGTVASPSDVLVAGAGPTGLVLALWLRRWGVSVRVVDKAAEPGTTSRALAVHARTLEFYRQAGIAGEVVERGLKFAAVNLWVRGKHAARAAFSDIGTGVSPFPYAMTFPQDEHERFLIEHLRREGVEVERGVSVTGAVEREDRVVCSLVGPEGQTTEAAATYVADCGGAHSALR